MEYFDPSLVEGRYPRYQGNVIRPLGEADSLVLQVMYGCSHGKCGFCGSYMDKAFRLRLVDAVREDVENLEEGVKERVRRVFLCDGDVLSLPLPRMVEILDLLAEQLPNLSRVSAYANAHSLVRLSHEELLEIRAHGLRLLYVGLESGDDETLSRSWKGLSAAQMVGAFVGARRAGFALSVTAILGLGGIRRSMEHARKTGQALTAIDPQYIGLFTLMLEPGTRMAEMERRGEFDLPGPSQMLRELREILAQTDVTDAVFRTNHASNYLAVGGNLPADKEAMLRALDRDLAVGGVASLGSEVLRGR
jgi:radical SAM superfamily enzyme YgiQ (UPF0313 family)